MCLFMAFSLLFVSCYQDRNGKQHTFTNDDIELLSQTGDLDNASFDEDKFGGKVLSAKEFQRLIEKVNNLDKVSSRDDIPKHLNNIFSEYGIDDAVSFESIDKLMKKYFYISTSGSYHTFLVGLKNTGEISKNEYQFLDKIDRQICQIGEFNEGTKGQYLKLINGLKNDINSSSYLSKQESERLVNFASIYENILIASDSGEKGPCIDCISGERGKIGFWQAIVIGILLTACLAVAVPSGGIALAPCLAIVFGAGLFTAFAVCWRQCFGNAVYCPNPECPADFNFDLQTGRCCIEDDGLGVVEGGGGNLFLSLPALSASDCADGWTYSPVFQACAFELDATWEDASLGENSVCVAALCD